jgi:hypothetical protein
VFRTSAIAFPPAGSIAQAGCGCPWLSVCFDDNWEYFPLFFEIGKNPQFREQRIGLRASVALIRGSDAKPADWVDRSMMPWVPPLGSHGAKAALSGSELTMTAAPCSSGASL